jgi:hypothetical protein
MESGEIIQRVVGVLVEAGEYKRSTLEGSDSHDDDDAEVIGQLVGDILRVELDVPDGASVQDVCEAIGTTLGPQIYRLLAGFALAFHELADVHDQGQTDVSSADVLRRLALRGEGA